MRIGISVERGAWRPGAHVLEKGLETITPPIADGDPDGAIGQVVDVLRIKAPRFHFAPADIFRRDANTFVLTGARAMGSRSLGKRVSASSAPAAGRVSAAQVVQRRHAVVAAIAEAAPIRVTPVPAFQANRHETTEPLAGDMSRGPQ